MISFLLIFHTGYRLFYSFYLFIFSGADLSALVREASVAALKECMAEKLSAGHHVIETQGSKGRTIIVKVDHFQVAFEKVKPSVSGKVYIYHLVFTQNRKIAVIFLPVCLLTIFLKISSSDFLS